MKRFPFLRWLGMSMPDQHPQDVPVLLSVDYDFIKEDVKTNPDKYLKLIDRFGDVDFKITSQEALNAYYAESFLDDFGTARSMENDMDKLADLRMFDELLKKAEEVLKLNPINIKALHNADFAYSEKVRKDSIWDSIGNKYALAMFRLMQAIAQSGDGSAEHPFLVTSVSDEYMFMRFGLRLREYSNQSLTKNGCDVINLSESNDRYEKKQIYFNVQRVLELEKELLGDL